MKIINRLDVFEKLEEWLTESFVETEEGYLKGRAIVTNTGIFRYLTEDGKMLAELRPDEEVFAVESLDSLKMIPVTFMHPKETVSKDNAKDYQVGFTGEDVRISGHAVSIPLTITDKEAIGWIRKRKSDNKPIALSCGYKAKLDFQSGTAFGNNPYDAIQRDIRYNHVALVESGRAGDLARIRMDSNYIGINDGNHKLIEKKNKGDNFMKTIRIDGVDYQAEADVIKAYTKLSKDAASQKADFDTFKSEKEKEVSKLNADIDTLKEKLEQKDEELKNNKIDSEKIESLVQDRLALKENAKKADIEELNDKSEIELKKEVITKVFPKANLEDRDDVYINARYDAAIETLDERLEKKNDAENKKAVNNPGAQKNDAGDNTAESARKKYIADIENAYKREAK